MSEPKKTESFAGNVMKYSIATYLGFGISGAALIIKGVLPAESYAVPASFMAYTMSLMNVGMLGLDQSLLRFYHEPPAGSTGRSMFAACTRLSVLVMLLVGGIGSIFFAKPLAAAFGLGANGAGLVLCTCWCVTSTCCSGWKTMCAPTPPKRCGCRPA